MGLTGLAPVLGAFSMWNIGTLTFAQLVLLFIIGGLAHIYGFVLNDIIDVNVDKLSSDLTTRPLVSGCITRKRAAYFAVSCMIISFLLTIFFFREINSYLILILILIVAFIFATIYDFMSKRYPGMDFFVAGAVFFGILFGAATIGTPTKLTWIVALIGGLQVLFMNMINGAIKDIDHDARGQANTVAIRLGAKVHAGMIALPLSFRTTGYLIEIGRTLLVFTPFVLLALPFSVPQLFALVVFVILTFVSIYRLYSIKTFDRKRIRKAIGITVIFMYATTPIMLSSLDLYFILAALIAPVWFIASNLLLHKTVFEPKTM